MCRILKLAVAPFILNQSSVSGKWCLDSVSNLKACCGTSPGNLVNYRWEKLPGWWVKSQKWLWHQSWQPSQVSVGNGGWIVCQIFKLVVSPVLVTYSSISENCACIVCQILVLLVAPVMVTQSSSSRKCCLDSVPNLKAGCGPHPSNLFKYQWKRCLDSVSNLKTGHATSHGKLSVGNVGWIVCKILKLVVAPVLLTQSSISGKLCLDTV